MRYYDQWSSEGTGSLSISITGPSVPIEVFMISHSLTSMKSMLGEMYFSIIFLLSFS